MVAAAIAALLAPVGSWIAAASTPLDWSGVHKVPLALSAATDLRIEPVTRTLVVQSMDSYVLYRSDGSLIGALPPEIRASKSKLAIGGGGIYALGSTDILAVDPGTAQVSVAAPLPAGLLAGAFHFVGGSRFHFQGYVPGSGNALLQFDSATGEVRSTALITERPYVGPVAGSTDGRWIAGYSNLWDGSTFPPTWVTSFSPWPIGPLDDSHLLAVETHGRPTEYHLPDGAPGLMYQTPGPVIHAAAGADPGGSIVVYGSRIYERELWFFGRGDATLRRTIPVPRDVNVTRLVTVGSTAWVLSGTDGGVRTIAIIDVPGPSPLRNAGEYHSLEPFRVFDSRTGTGGLAGPLGPADSRTVQVAGAGPIPTGGVVAVVVNVTITEPTEGTYLTVYPSGDPVPYVSNLNVPAGVTRANLAVVRVGHDGSVVVRNAAGWAHAVLDVQGWFSDLDGPDGARFRPITPKRVLDGRYAGPGFLAAGQAGYVDLNGTCDGADGVVLNVTAIAATDPTYVSVFPGGGPIPHVSNINVPARSVVPNLVFARIGGGTRVGLFNAAGTTYVIADALGCFDSRSLNEAGRFVPVAQPYRAFDTRRFGAALGPSTYLSASLAGVPDSSPLIPTPAGGGAAILLNLTVTEPTEASVVAAYSSDLGDRPPQTSNLNFNAGDTVANLTVTPIGQDGRINVANAVGTTHLVGDVAGWFTSEHLSV
jgi:hypothetical protein